MKAFNTISMPPSATTRRRSPSPLATPRMLLI
ncbi:uncharacterized protein G2W53_040474 [Senna tora]|uniref:Uncharacterized protein n=1 Tax=Senna tora TaxID=362788 RepID=A0A834VX96_9FABA|nr:uncharacterized protein G2W53_040474 [Senna tora]